MSDRDRANSLNAAWQALGIAASSCPAFDSSTQQGAAFDADFSAWETFLRGTIVFDGSVLDDWQTKVSQWQTLFASAGCAAPGVKISPPSTTATTLTFAVLGVATLLAMVYVVAPLTRSVRR